MLFHFLIKIKVIFSTLCVARRHVCFVLFWLLKQSVTVTSIILFCFKLIGWFNHHNVFPPSRSVCYRFLHCDYRKLRCDYKKLHCDYRKLHCCLGLTALKSTNHSRVISLCILLVYVIMRWLVQLGINSTSDVWKSCQNWTSRRGESNLANFQTSRVLLIPNCTSNIVWLLIYY
jgi:hypothetical protein